MKAERRPSRSHLLRSAALCCLICMAPACVAARATPEPSAGRTPAASSTAGSFARTGVDAVDRVIRAVLGGDVEEQRALIRYTRAPCTHREGLGGPPKCRAGEVEGTAVEVLPFLGPEGHHLRRDEMAGWAGLSAPAVHAAYRNSARVYSDAEYPAGEYAVVFAGRQPPNAVTVQVGRDGIVRIDYIFELPDVNALGRIAAEMLIPPETP